MLCYYKMLNNLFISFYSNYFYDTVTMLENYAAVLHGPNDLRLQKWPVPEIDENDVLVRMSCVGICGSDVKIYSTGVCGNDVITEPFVIGHEGSGVVEKVGAKVTNLKVGDRVAIEPTQPCRRCEFCKRGKYNLCEEPGYCASAGTPGNLCQYYRHVADFCHKIPDNVTLEEAAAVQPLAIAIHACNRASIQLGSKIAIFGAGPIGVLCAMTARAMGASRILITDVVQSRLDIARKLAADYTLLTRSSDKEEAIECQIIETLGQRPDITIGACGYPSATRVAMNVTRPSGVLVVVGIGPARVEVPLTSNMLREVDIRGSYRINNTYVPAIEAVSSGAINLKQFITHRFALRDASEALRVAQSGEAMKTIIHVQN